MSQRLSNIVRSNDHVPSNAALHVEVIADLICPFCYLGKRRLDEALTAVRGPCEISWYPWELNPTMPESGLSFNDYLASRFGSAVAVQPVLDGLATEGAKEGIEFRFDKIETVPNTLKAHQLMYLAEVEGVDQSALAEDLMKAFFAEGKNIGKREVLTDIAAQHGLQPEAVERMLNDEKAKQVVLTREGQARSSGIAGVPGFLLNRRLFLVGAQDPDSIVNAFDRAMFGEGTDRLVSPALN
jgi:predicted DsbA family dithiol-disulfide isomerase